MEKYKPSEESLKFIAFIRACATEDNANAEIHYRLADKYFSDSKQIVIESFRGSAKSTLMEWLVLYTAVMGELPGFGEVGFIAFVGDSAENGVKSFFRNLAAKIDRSDLLRQMLTIKRKTDAEMELANADGTELYLKGFGASALALDTKLYTDSGYTTIGECRVGDKIYGPNGVQSTIITKSQVFNKPSYRLELEDGRCLTLSDDHINNVYIKTSVGNSKFKEKNLTTTELMDIPLRASKPSSPNKYEPMVYIKNTKPVEYSSKELPIDPYLLGYALGDGSFQGSQIRIHVQDLDYDELVTNLGDVTIGKVYTDVRHNKSNPVKSFGVLKQNNALRELTLDGVSCKNKFVPNIYKFGSIDQRIALLQGLLDSDGTIDKEGRRIRFSNTSKQLAEDVAELVRSLGGYATITASEGVPGTKNPSTCYRVFIHIDINVFRLSRKSSRFVVSKYKKDKVAIKSIEKVESVPTQCIAIDSDDHLFLAGDYVTTHNTNIRGVRYKNLRPSVVILDDITTNEAKTSEAIQNTINDNFYKSIIPALHPTRYKIFYIGTPISENDLLHQLGNNPEWVVHKFPICEKFPCSKEEFVGAWEDRFPYEAVKSKYDMYKASGKEQDFAQEYMLEIVDLSTLLVEEDDIKWYDPALVLKNKSAYNYYISTDFATSTKKSADYSTIAVWAVSYNNDWLLVDGQCKRQSMQDNIEDLFQYAKKWKPISVGIESSGQQGGFLSIIEEMKQQRNVWFQFAKKPGSKEYGIRPTKDKVHRFVTGVQPKFKQGKIWLPRPEVIKGTNYRLFEAVEELVNELSKFTMAGGVTALKHDDMIDTLNQLSEMEIWAPSDDNVVEKSTVTEDGLVWSGIWEDDDDDDYKGNTVF